MDHLPSFGATPTIEVPYVCERMYDGDSFFEYPSRMGWDKGLLYQGNFEERSLREVASVLQSWMYFGPLFHIFNLPGMNFDPQHFIRTKPDGGEVITTEKLPHYAQALYERGSGKSEEEKMQKFISIRGCLAELHRFVLRYCGKDSSLYHPPPTFWPLNPEISLSIIVLADSLTKAGFETTGRQFNLDWGVSGFLYHRMVDAWWCPSVLNILSSAQQVHLLYYAYTMGRPETSRDHRNCNKFICKTNQIDDQHYQSKHVDDCAGCEFRGPDMKSILEILDSGKIPLIECYEVNDIFEIRIHQHDRSMGPKKYLAFSHIWADGIGNPFENTLPSCQLRRLQRLAHYLENQGSEPIAAWWLDTLCVPVRSLSETYRDLAITRMRQTYENCEKILVLDSDLLGSAVDAPLLEIYMRIKLSNWMRRLWTLQEGIVAKDIHFQFRGGTRRIVDIDQGMMREGIRTKTFIYTRYSFDSFDVLGPFIHGKQQQKQQRLMGLWKRLQWRSTSQRADETICLATMLGIDPDPMLGLARTDWEGRMRTFLEMANVIPAAILFQPPPRLSQHGFRWAPASFLMSFRNSGTRPHAVIPGIASVLPDGQGLSIARTGIRVMPRENGLPLIAEDFQIRLASRGENPSFIRVRYVGSSPDESTDREATNIDGSRNLSKPAIILGQELHSQPTVDGALVDICQEGMNHISCNFIAWVGLQRESQSGLPIQGMKSVEGSILGGQQNWLVMRCPPVQGREANHAQRSPAPERITVLLG